jgi:2-methylcitrate dehydratase PrpD
MEVPQNDIEKAMHDLVSWAASISLEEIPEDVLRRAVIIIADDLAAMIAAQKEPEVVSIRKKMLSRRTVEEATVFQSGRYRTDRQTAAIINAMAANWCEIDEGYRKATCHAGLYTLPALLAEAEAENKSVGQVLRAAIVSYEVITRIARAWDFSACVVHPHAIFAAVGASAAISSLRALDNRTFYNALTSSATLIVVGPYNHAIKGALVENMWAASGAWHGIMSADWALCGIGGLGSSFYDVYTTVLGGKVHAKNLTCNLGIEWGMRDGYHKLFACCQYGHSAVESTLAVLAHMPPGKTIRDIKRVTVETHARGLTLDNFTPETTLAAKFSMQHIVAAVLVFGHANVEAFDSLSLRNPDVLELRNKVKLRPFLPEREWPNDRPSRVIVELHDGLIVSQECISAKGGPDRPFTEKEILEKVKNISKDSYPFLTETLTSFLDPSPAKLAQSWNSVVMLLTGGKPK